MEEFNLWEGTERIVEQAYNGKNYKIWDRGNDSPKCLILFSGNGLYYPNTRSVFEKIIINDDRYEYENLAKSKYLKEFSRIIFVRDIMKQWYITGINEHASDVVKTVEVLSTITEGYILTTAGNSAGGYAAVLFGILLHAKQIFSFSGQFTIEHVSSVFVNKYRDDASRACYYNLCGLIKSAANESTIFYFWPDRNEKDCFQHSQVEKISSIHSFEFISEKHERTVLPFQIPWLLSCDTEYLTELCRKYDNHSMKAWAFLRESMGLWEAVKETTHYFIMKSKRFFCKQT